MEQELKYIEVSRIWDHPDNPRKDLGDLTELTERIKKNGILQNLTVVPKIGEITRKWDGESYKVIIGHRRLHAARLAGLAKVPCVVAEMDEKEQVRTMLMENVQRSDLTPLEQAQGFQMMIDLGSTVQELAKDTGFTQATIKKRLEWAKLDKDTFKKVSDRQISMTDLNKLSEIQDIDLRNEALGAIGTNNFESKLQDCIKQEQLNDALAQWRELLPTFAEEMPKEDRQNCFSKYEYRLAVNRWNIKELEVPKDADRSKYFFTDDDTEIRLYKLRPEDEDREIEETPEEKARRERAEADERKRLELIEIAEKHFHLRRDFVDALSLTVENKEAVMLVWEFMTEHLVKMLMNNLYKPLDVETLSSLFHLRNMEDVGDFDDMPMSLITHSVMNNPALGIFKVIYSALDSERKTFYKEKWMYTPAENTGYYFIYEDNPGLRAIYELLEKLGYELSDEEESFRDGTHPLFDTLPEED